MLIEPRGARVVGLVFVVGAKGLDTVASAYALHSAPSLVSESNPFPSLVYGELGILGLFLLTVVALGVLIGVTEWAGRYVEANDESPHHKKNLLSIYALGYWAPGVLWLWVGLYNINLIYTYLHAGL